MTEYTSLDVSRRLAEAGFKAEERHLVKMVEDGRGGAADIWGYRTDTLMEWLAERGMITYLAKSSKGFHVAYALTGVWLWTANADAKTIPDSLGEVVLAVLAKEAEHDQG
jgi:hypothetical protein